MKVFSAQGAAANYLNDGALIGVDCAILSHVWLLVALSLQYSCGIFRTPCFGILQYVLGDNQFGNLYFSDKRNEGKSSTYHRMGALSPLVRQLRSGVYTTHACSQVFFFPCSLIPFTQPAVVALNCYVRVKSVIPVATFVSELYGDAFFSCYV